MPNYILSPVADPNSSELLSPDRARAWKAAQDFEAMAVGQLLAPMFETINTAKGVFGGGEGEAAWRPMMTQELGKQIAKSGGLGLAVPIYRQMLVMQEQAGKVAR
jgi:Rod binding domain-containing protein